MDHDPAGCLPPDLQPLLADCFCIPFGLALRAGEGWDCLLIRREGPGDYVELCELSLRGFSAILGEARKSWTLPDRSIEGLATDAPDFPFWVSSWILDGLCLEARYGRLIPSPDGELKRELRMEDLSGSAWDERVADMKRSYYWHEGWEPEFYAAQARAGCIAISSDRGDRAFLLPELQEAYAVLDWGNVHKSRSLERLFRSGRLEALGVQLRFNADPRAVLDALAERWGAHSWLRPEYRAMIEAMADAPVGGMRVWGVELWAKGEGGTLELAAGELGYTIGRTYTSLSGFHRREKREWNDLGKVQLQLLARRLEEGGFAFWNLGHPYMQYKRDLGARILTRQEFLGRWNAAVAATNLPCLPPGARLPPPRAAARP